MALASHSALELQRTRVVATWATTTSALFSRGQPFPALRSSSQQHRSTHSPHSSHNSPNSHADAVCAIRLASSVPRLTASRSTYPVSIHLKSTSHIPLLTSLIAHGPQRLQNRLRSGFLQTSATATRPWQIPCLSFRRITSFSKS